MSGYSPIVDVVKLFDLTLLAAGTNVELKVDHFAETEEYNHYSSKNRIEESNHYSSKNRIENRAHGADCHNRFLANEGRHYLSYAETLSDPPLNLESECNNLRHEWKTVNAENIDTDFCDLAAEVETDLRSNCALENVQSGNVSSPINRSINESDLALFNNVTSGFHSGKELSKNGVKSFELGSYECTVKAQIGLDDFSNQKLSVSNSSTDIRSPSIAVLSDKELRLKRSNSKSEEAMELISSETSIPRAKTVTVESDIASQPGNVDRTVAFDQTAVISDAQDLYFDISESPIYSRNIDTVDAAISINRRNSFKTPLASFETVSKSDEDIRDLSLKSIFRTDAKDISDVDLSFEICKEQQLSMHTRPKLFAEFEEAKSGLGPSHLQETMGGDQKVLILSTRSSTCNKTCKDRSKTEREILIKRSTTTTTYQMFEQRIKPAANSEESVVNHKNDEEISCKNDEEISCETTAENKLQNGTYIPAIFETSLSVDEEVLVTDEEETNILSLRLLADSGYEEMRHEETAEPKRQSETNIPAAFEKSLSIDEGALIADQEADNIPSSLTDAGYGSFDVTSGVYHVESLSECTDYKRSEIKRYQALANSQNLQQDVESVSSPESVISDGLGTDSNHVCFKTVQTALPGLFSTSACDEVIPSGILRCKLSEATNEINMTHENLLTEDKDCDVSASHQVQQAERRTHRDFTVWPTESTEISVASKRYTEGEVENAQRKHKFEENLSEHSVILLKEADSSSSQTIAESSNSKNTSVTFTDASKTCKLNDLNGSNELPINSKDHLRVFTHSQSAVESIAAPIINKERKESPLSAQIQNIREFVRAALPIAADNEQSRNFANTRSLLQHGERDVTTKQDHPEFNLSKNPCESLDSDQVVLLSSIDLAKSDGSETVAGINSKCYNETKISSPRSIIGKTRNLQHETYEYSADYYSSEEFNVGLHGHSPSSYGTLSNHLYRCSSVDQKAGQELLRKENGRPSYREDSVDGMLSETTQNKLTFNSRPKLSNSIHSASTVHQRSATAIRQSNLRSDWPTNYHYSEIISSGDEQRVISTKNAQTQTQRGSVDPKPAELARLLEERRRIYELLTRCRLPCTDLIEQEETKLYYTMGRTDAMLRMISYAENFEERPVTMSKVNSFYTTVPKYRPAYHQPVSHLKRF